MYRIVKKSMNFEEYDVSLHIHLNDGNLKFRTIKAIEFDGWRMEAKHVADQVMRDCRSLIRDDDGVFHPLANVKQIEYHRINDRIGTRNYDEAVLDYRVMGVTFGVLFIMMMLLFIYI